jgi:hypothetical protein
MLSYPTSAQLSDASTENPLEISGIAFYRREKIHLKILTTKTLS